MKIAVCVKYVPVVARIQFDYQNKTIVREGVPSEVNSFDMLGVIRAAELKQSPDDEGRRRLHGPAPGSGGTAGVSGYGRRPGHSVNRPGPGRI